MRPLVILGAGGHGKVVADAAAASGEFSSISFLDDSFPDTLEVSGWQVIGKLGDISKQAPGCAAIVALGDNDLRSEWLGKLIGLGIEVATIRHPMAIVAERVSIGEGTVLMAGSVINIDASVGKGCIINTGSTIDHDCLLGNCVHVSPGASLGGGVVVGECAWIGIGACVIHNINIGARCIVGAGSVVLQPVENGATVGGCPAKELNK
jgi:sugar O-acyltransferase (sialic acid O-acetyltransferase NeuD family)